MSHLTNKVLQTLVLRLDLVSFHSIFENRMMKSSVCSTKYKHSQIHTYGHIQIFQTYSWTNILSPYLFNLYAEYIRQNAGLDEAQARIKIAGRYINNLRYADDTTLMAESEELKSLLMKVKEEHEKVALKLNIQKTKIMASGPITSWQIDGETMETVIDFIFGGSKITADGDCSHEIKRHLLLGRKAMTNLDSILKSRDITDKGLSSQSYGFSSGHVWM